MAQGNAMHCACYEDVKSSTAYFIGMLDGKKGNIPDRMVELMCADQEGRVIVLPCKVGDTVWRLKRTFETWPDTSEPYAEADAFALQDVGKIGKTVFLTLSAAEKALAGLEDKKDG